MTRQIILKKNVLSMEMAYVIDQELISYYVESSTETNWQNCIVIGQVQNIVKNLNAVFIDYGKDKKGLLHFKYIPDDYLEHMKQGYLLPVQVIKQNTGSKGDKLTAKLNLTGKYLVCLPFESGIYFSKKITQQSFKTSLKQELEHLEAPYGFIVRTHASKSSIEAILQDARTLIEQTSHLLEQSHYLIKGSILYEEQSSIYQMLIEQLMKSAPLEIICDHQEVKTTIESFIHYYSCLEYVQLSYREAESNIFAAFGLTKKIEQLTKRKVWLKSGGNIMIDETEAMTVVDVNSAKAVLVKNANKALLALNKEAIKETILQILRRHLSGIIIVDLVEMKDEAYSEELYHYAKTLLKTYEEDQINVYPLTELGLLQFARTKTYPSVTQKLLESCTVCHHPASQKSLLAHLMQLEESLKPIATNQKVYLNTSPYYYERMIEDHVIERLEEQYPIQVELEKPSLAENQILCQFYKK